MPGGLGPSDCISQTPFLSWGWSLDGTHRRLETGGEQDQGVSPTTLPWRLLHGDSGSVCFLWLQPLSLAAALSGISAPRNPGSALPAPGLVTASCLIVPLLDSRPLSTPL